MNAFGASMDIIFYHPSFDTQFWLNKLSQALSQARVREWKPGDNEPADYALVWPSGITPAEKAAAVATLTSLGVLVRQSV